MKTSWASVMLACSLAFGLGGCVSSRGRANQVNVAMNKSGVLTVEGKAVNMAELPASVRKAGAAADTRIRVEILPDTPVATRTAIGRTLAAAGYTRVFFFVPRQAFAESAGP